MAGREGWTKEPAANAHEGWTKEPAEAPSQEPSFLDRAGELAAKAPSALVKTWVDINQTPQRILQDGLGAELEPSAPTGAALRSFGNAASFGLTDKLRGVGGAADELSARVSPLRNENDQQFPRDSAWIALKKRYAMERDSSYREQDTADKEQPVISGGAKVLGAIATPNPFGKVAALGRVGRLAAGAGQGALYGLGSSRAEDVGGKLKDTAIGGAIGLGGAAVAEAPSALAKAFGGLKAKGAAAAEAATSSVRTKDMASEAGRFGSVSKEPLSAYRTLESEIAAGAATPEQVAEFEAFKTSPLGVSTRQRAIGNLLKRLPSHEGQMVEAEGAFNAASDAASPDAVAAATKKYLGESVLLRDVAPKLERIATRAIPAAVGSAGGPLGIGAGALTGAAMGAPGTTLANMMKSPGFQHRVGQVGEGLAAPVAASAKALASGAPSLLSRYFGDPSELTDEEKQAIEERLVAARTSR